MRLEIRPPIRAPCTYRKSAGPGCMTKRSGWFGACCVGRLGSLLPGNVQEHAGHPRQVPPAAGCRQRAAYRTSASVGQCPLGATGGLSARASRRVPERHWLLERCATPGAMPDGPEKKLASAGRVVRHDARHGRRWPELVAATHRRFRVKPASVPRPLLWQELSGVDPR